jgi:hypothetical protein
MFDTHPVLFILLGMYLIIKERFATAGIAEAIAISLKFFHTVLAVPMILLTIRLRGSKGSVRFVIGLFSSGVVLLLPTLLSSVQHFGYYIFGSSASSEFNYFGITFWTSIALFWSKFDPAWVASFMVILALILSYVWAWPRLSLADSLRSSIVVGMPIVCLLLLYRSVAENFFVWLIPFLIIISVKDDATRRLTWGISGLALLSSVTVSLLPYYLLPLSPWIGGLLATALSVVTPFRVAPSGKIAAGLSFSKGLLAGYGVAMALLLIGLIVVWMRICMSRVTLENSLGD